MLVFRYDVLDKNLSETFGEITRKYKIDEIMEKLFNSLNEMINKEGYFTTIKSTTLSNELLKTLKILENCTSCKDNLGKYNLDKFHVSISIIEHCLAKLEEEEKGEETWKWIAIIRRLNNEVIKIDDELNRKVLCESCKG